MNRLLPLCSLVLVCIILNAWIPASAQAGDPATSPGSIPTPHLSGSVSIGLKQGTISTDLRLSDLPSLDTNFRVLMNRGLNLNLFRDSSGVLKYSDQPRGDYLAYRPYYRDSLLRLGSTLRVSATGAFPVYTDTMNWFDYKGWVAFNGSTLRAADQTKWYPVIYDVINDRELSAMSYDLTINCAECKTIYLNGSEAQPGPIAHFVSQVPRDLLLFAGDYDAQKFPGNDFLNASMPDSIAIDFDRQINSIRSYYESVLGVPYKQKITFLEHKPVQRYRPNQSWAFVTFPTFAFAGIKLSDDIRSSTGKFVNIPTYRFYAHELGHYYFGTVLRPNSTLFWFFLESTAEYLSLKAMQHAYGRDTLDAYVDGLKKDLSKEKILPLSALTSSDQMHEVYRYNYAPLILLALEQRVGEKKVFALLHYALTHPGESTDFSFFERSALAAGITPAQWAKFKTEVINLTSGAEIFRYLKPGH